MTTQTLPRLSHCVFDLKFHLVLVTKYRRKCLRVSMIARLSDIFAQVLYRWDCDLLECNGEPDHVHLLCALNPKVQPSKLVNNLKTISCRRLWRSHSGDLRKTYRRPGTLWSRSYFLSTVGGAPLAVLKRYVQSQNVPVWPPRHTSTQALRAMDGALRGEDW